MVHSEELHTHYNLHVQKRVSIKKIGFVLFYSILFYSILFYSECCDQSNIRLDLKYVCIAGEFFNDKV